MALMDANEITPAIMRVRVSGASKVMTSIIVKITRMPQTATYSVVLFNYHHLPIASRTGGTGRAK